jgi:hypothetical protein
MAVALTTNGAPLPTGASLRSMAMIECGTSWTHATLLGMAEGHCRLLARASAPTTPVEIGEGITAALNQVAAITGRRLFAQGRTLSPETEAGDGADGVGFIGSVNGPLRVMLLGPGLGVWGAGLRRALATVAVTPLLAPGLAAEAYPFLQADPLDSAAHQPPHLLLILGPGSEALANPQARTALEEAAQTALQLLAGFAEQSDQLRFPAVGVLGSPEEQAVARQALAGRDIISIEPTAPGHPGTLTQALGQLYEQLVLSVVPGFGRIRSWSSTSPISTVAAMGRFVRFLAQRYAMNVLLVNVGATGTAALGASSHGNLFTSQAPLAGVRQGAGAVWRRAGYAQIARWLPFDQPEAALREMILQRMTQPYALPITPTELALEHALAREALRLVVEQGATPGGISDLPRMDVIIGTGSVLANCPEMAQAALLLLDAVQPRGITSLVIDAAQLAAPLGAASLLDPMASADAVDMDALLVQLGTCVSTVGSPPAGEAAVRVVLEYSDGHQHTAEVLPETIESLPLAVGQRARMTLYPAPGVDIGLGPGERAFAGDPVEGGRLGLIVDARGRPFTLPADPQQRQAKLRQWVTALSHTTAR